MSEQTYELNGVIDFYFPYPVRNAGQITVELVPGGVVAAENYEVIGAGPTATGVTVRYPDAPSSETIQLKISRYVNPSRVTAFEDDVGVTAAALNAEFDNIYMSLEDFLGIAAEDWEEYLASLEETGEALIAGFQADVDAAAETLNGLVAQAQSAASDAEEAAETVLAGAISNTLLTSAGDMIYAAAAETPAVLPIAADDRIMSVQSGLPAWIVNPAVLKSMFTAEGDMVYATAAATLTRRAIGAENTILTAVSNRPTWVLPFYSGTSASRTEFPVGTVLLCHLVATTKRNGIVNVYLYNAVDYAFTTYAAAGGAQLTGEWHARGCVLGSAVLVQRVS